MKKRKAHSFGKNVYLLGRDSEGINYYLEDAYFFKGGTYYWDGDSVVAYENNEHPEKARDIAFQSHFDSMFFKGNRGGSENFKEFFAETPFTDFEVERICKLMEAFYISRHYSNMLFCARDFSSVCDVTPARAAIMEGAKSEQERINKKILPAIMGDLYKILEE